VIHTLDDCCLHVVIVGAVPVLTLEDGDTDPFTGEMVMWPSPRVYWSNGTITDGYVEETNA